MKPKYTDLHKYPEGYTPAKKQGPDYLKKKFDAIRRQQKAEAEKPRVRIVATIEPKARKA
ncbi:MAG: hypothetical protein ACYC2K_01695 [Gemmatimonadales bacterium]